MARAKSAKLAALAELEAIEAEIARRESVTRGYCPHTPSERQAEFLALVCLEAMYGGAVGGGKSNALLMAALQHVHVPGYAALILRRTYADLALPGAIMDRAKAWLIPQGVAWNDKDKRFTFPSGASITFGYLDTDTDRFRYQGAELQYIGFDELTQFPEGWYRYLLSRLRRLAGASVPLRARSASNPGGLGHEWVKRRFIDARVPGRAFVRATLDDNPHLDVAEYEKSLALLDATTRRQLRDGIWVRDATGLVYRYQPANDIAALPMIAPGESWTLLLGLDFGVRDATAYVVLAWRERDPVVYVVESYKESGKSPSEVAESVQALSTRYPFAKIVGDLGGMGKAFAAEMTRRYSIPIEAADKVNKRGYIALMNGALERRLLRLVGGANEQLAAELLELPWADETHQHESDGFDNHLTDALLYAWRACNSFHERVVQPPPVHGTDEHWRAEEERMERQAEEAFEAERRDRAAW